MRSEKDRDWELPFGSPGELSVLMDIRDELKQLNRQFALLAIEINHHLAELQKMFAAQQTHQMEKNMVELMAKAQAKGLIEDAEPSKAYPPPAPSPPPPARKQPVHTVRRKR